MSVRQWQGDSVSEEAKRLAAEHAAEIVRGYISRVTQNWVHVDHFSSWVTGASGAALALAANRLNAFESRFGTGTVKGILWALALVVLAGLVEKYLAFLVCMHVEAEKAGTDLVETFDERTKPAIERLRVRVSEEEFAQHYAVPLTQALMGALDPTIPWPVRWIVRRKVAKQAGNPHIRQL